MAQKLYDYFLRAGEAGGVQARTRLSILAKMTSTEAKTKADSDEEIKKLELHFQTVIKEFGNGSQSKSQPATITDSGSKSA